MRKTDALKIEKKIISQASTTDNSLLTASYFISLQVAKYKILIPLAKNSLSLL